MSDSSKSATRMEMSDLLELAREHHHDIHEIRLVESPSFAVEDSIGRCHIAMSDELTERDRTVCLAHELGHCEYGGFYNYHSPFEVRSRAENRANRWAYLKVLPLDEIQVAIQSNDNLWDLADYFGVTPEFMEKCLKFYVEQLGRQLCPEKRNRT